MFLTYCQGDPMQTTMTATEMHVVTIKYDNGAKRLLIKTTDASAVKSAVKKVKNAGLLKNGVIKVDSFVLHGAA
jgi:outer membrane lipoprotein SlyB